MKSMLRAVFFALLLCAAAVLAASKPKSVMVLKLPRSGSSWFVSLLSQQRGVWVVPQLLKPDGEHEEQNDARDIELLQAALSAPYKANEAELGEAQRLVGFSMNPLKMANESRFDDGKLLAPLVKKRDAFVVLYERTNLVKQAIATMRGACLKQLCHFNNIVSNAAAWNKSHVLLNGANSSKDFQACALAQRQRVPLKELRCTIVWHAAARDTLRRLHALVAPRADRRLYVAYEALQRNLTGTLAALFADSALGPLDGALQTVQFFSKTTDENLKDVVLNYGEVFEMFEEERSACLLEMLQVDHARQFNTSDCPMPRSWLKECRAWLPQPKPLAPGFPDHCLLVSQ